MHGASAVMIGSTRLAALQAKWAIHEQGHKKERGIDREWERETETNTETERQKESQNAQDHDNLAGDAERRSLHTKRAWLFFCLGLQVLWLRLGHALHEKDNKRATDKPEKNISNYNRPYVGEQEDTRNAQIVGQETQDARGLLALSSWWRMPHMTTSTSGKVRNPASLM